MRTTNGAWPVFALLGVASIASAQVQIESFDGGVFTNPFFNHVLEFDDPCCWEIVEDSPKDFELHLRPNFDIITFNLEPGELVESVCVTLRDFEGGFVGDSPTSVMIVRASSNDFVFLNAAFIGVEDIVCADVDSIGQLFGKPLGDIVEISFQAANEGNSVLPGVGAFYDDITVTLSASVGPDAFDAFRGFHESGTLDDVLVSDDMDLCHDLGITIFPTEAPITLDFDGTLPTDSPASLDVTFESSANTPGLELTISFWNYNTNSWDVVGTAAQGFNVDAIRTFAGDPVDHVETGTGAVRTRYEVRQAGIIFQFPWTDCIDQVFWTTS